jgi:mono/diheme cytochrome c family protein
MRHFGMRRSSFLVISLVFALLASPLAAQEDLGKKVYDKWCEQCHGTGGAGDGAAASRVKPRPRDFTQGKYKVRSTLTGDLPTDEDLRNAVRRGLYYSTMPAFDQALTEAEIDAVVEYIKTFSADFADPEYNNPEPITIPEPPPYDAENAATVGKEIYEQTDCGRCHGVLGRGDGNAAPTLKDDWGQHVRIADLTISPRKRPKAPPRRSRRRATSACGRSSTTCTTWPTWKDRPRTRIRRRRMRTR